MTASQFLLWLCGLVALWCVGLGGLFWWIGRVRDKRRTRWEG